MTITMLFYQQLRGWILSHATAMEVIICKERRILAGKSVKRKKA
jgi:hypothetical protein